MAQPVNGGPGAGSPADPSGPSRPVRIAIGLAFLLVVNLLAGWLAQELRYPSLWGNSQVFAEYAWPLPYGWSMVHWVSMLPLAFVVAALPGWPPSRLVRTRWILLGLLAAVLFVEVEWPYGRLNRIPFLLFFAVDFSVALLVSLAIRPPLRALAGAAALLVLGFAVLRWLAAPEAPREAGGPPPAPAADSAAAEPVTRDATGFFSDSEVSVLRAEREVRITLYLADTVQPGQPPSPEAICRAAEARYAELAAVRVRPDGYRERVRFMAHPWFEPERKYVYPAGEAGMDESGHWACAFEYPQPDAGT